ncbi:MAG TPA: hypothetical protein VN924_03120 [Bryobacteraceae bacterium]|nr:hypothetical protein [Bryobacteraceae bacterium]
MDGAKGTPGEHSRSSNFYFLWRVLPVIGMVAYAIGLQAFGLLGLIGAGWIKNGHSGTWLLTLELVGLLAYVAILIPVLKEVTAEKFGRDLRYMFVSPAICLEVFFVIQIFETMN